MVSHLIEPGVHYFYKKTLQGCHHVKEKYYNGLYNLGLFIGFILIVGIILFFKKKTKPTLEDREKQKRIQYEYIISKLRNYQDIRGHQQPSLNADQPIWDNNPDVQVYNRKIYM
jgi:esterase/lipase